MSKNYALEGGLIGSIVGIAGMAVGAGLIVATGGLAGPVVAVAATAGPAVGAGIGALFSSSTPATSTPAEPKPSAPITPTPPSKPSSPNNSTSSYYSSYSSDSNNYYTPPSTHKRKRDEGNGSPSKKTRKLDQDGQELFKNKKYEQAIEKYDLALKDSDIDKETKNTIKNHKADALNAWGNELFNVRHFNSAKKKYEEAHKICTKTYTNRKEFKDNIDDAQAAILCRQADKLYNESQYTEATKKYQKAYDICPKQFSDRHYKIHILSKTFNKKLGENYETRLV
jgi:hypothetical protein